MGNCLKSSKSWPRAPPPSPIRPQTTTFIRCDTPPYHIVLDRCTACRKDWLQAQQEREKLLSRPNV